MLYCNNISKSYGIDNILTDITFKINQNDRIGIVGKNGAGKTTLFKIITGIIDYDSGELSIPKNYKIGYLSQNLDLNENHSIYEELNNVFIHFIDQENEIRKIQVEMGESKNLDKLMNKYSQLIEDFTEKGGYEYSSRIRGMLNGFGFKEDEYSKVIKTLSGGQKTRIALAKLLLVQPNLLLLDEPTNYLDMSTMEWLENYLKSYHGEVIIISHDRYFLDSIVNKIFEIENHKLLQFEGNYSYYVKRKKENYETSVHQYEVQQKEIQRQKEIIQRFKQFNREKSIKQAESREKMLNRIEPLEKPAGFEKKVNLVLEPQIKSSKLVFQVNNLKKSYSGNLLLDDTNFTVLRGEKIGIIGENGTGKSTLLKIIMDQVTPDEGNVEKGNNVYLDIFRQEHETLNKDNDILQEVWISKPSAREGEIRNFLASFKFIGEDIYKKISNLSGGEVSRVSLAKLILSKSNVLLMDEPTNHLDMETKEVLEEALCNYLGTVLVVSHDRYFLNRVADKIFILENKKITIYNGNYDYYVAKVNEQKLLEEYNNKPIEMSKTQKNQIKKAAYLEKKALKELKQVISTLELEIASTEKQISDFEKEMCSDNFYDDFDLATKITDQYNDSKLRLNFLMDEWTEKQIELEENN